jgi:hypothetical protein
LGEKFSQSGHPDHSGYTENSIFVDVGPGLTFRFGCLQVLKADFQRRESFCADQGDQGSML